MSYWKWCNSLIPGRSPISDMHPWMTFQAVAFINKYVKPFDDIFEYGGGGSTLFFLKKGANVKTVENDKNWYDLLRKKIQENNWCDQWLGYLELPQPAIAGKAGDFSNPNLYMSSSTLFKNYVFENYVKTIDIFDDFTFNFLVIDGRSRPSCIKHGARKVKIGGYLVLDNADREHYVTELTNKYLDDFDLLLDCYGPCPYINYFIKTKIWRRIR